jgi:hypothetical protein
MNRVWVIHTSMERNTICGKLVWVLFFMARGQVSVPVAPRDLNSGHKGRVSLGDYTGFLSKEYVAPFI